MTIQLARKPGEPWWRASIVLNGHDPKPFQPERPIKVKGKYNLTCQRFACDNSPALWYNQANGRYYCSDCARTVNEVLRRHGRKAVCELHLSR